MEENKVIKKIDLMRQKADGVTDIRQDNADDRMIFVKFISYHLVFQRFTRTYEEVSRSNIRVEKNEGRKQKGKTIASLVKETRKRENDQRLQARNPR